MSSLINVPGIERTSPRFRWALFQLGARMGLDADFLAVVMSLESGFNSAATNPQSGATGLIQFMPATAKLLGTTTGALRAMSGEAQLSYVEKFYRRVTYNHPERIQSAGDAYMATIMPAHIGKDPSYIIARAGERVYDQNAGLDVDRDATLTVGDVEAKAESRYNLGMARLRVDVPDEEPPVPKAPEGASGA